jgi:hypothetical protein
MQFLCLVHFDRERAAAMSPADKEAFDRENRDYGKWLEGHAVMFSSLQEPETATLLRSREGKLSMTDGPYVETKEHLAGFIVLDAPNREAAIEIMKDCPVTRTGTLEIRPSDYVAPIGPGR